MYKKSQHLMNLALHEVFQVLGQENPLAVAGPDPDPIESELVETQEILT
jgi:hypothetical protein